MISVCMFLIGRLRDVYLDDEGDSCFYRDWDDFWLLDRFLFRGRGGGCGGGRGGWGGGGCGGGRSFFEGFLFCGGCGGGGFRGGGCGGGGRGGGRGGGGRGGGGRGGFRGWGR